MVEFWELQQQQEKDPTLKILLQAKDTGEKPDAGSFQHHSVEAQRLLQLCDQLVVRDGVHYQKYVYANGAPDRTTLQYVVPCVERSDVIRHLLDVSTGGHLDIEKTVSKLQERYYWPDHWGDVELF